MINNRSRGTSLGMRRWYVRYVPRCTRCKKTRLVRYEQRQIGLCARCRKDQIRQIKAMEYRSQTLEALYVGESGRLERGRRYRLKPLFAGGALVGRDIKEFLEHFVDFKEVVE